MSKNVFLMKKTTCPICLTEFLATTVRRSKCIPRGKESDFHSIYSDVIPYHYDTWVCPECHYAAPKSVFNKITPEEVNKLAEVLSKSTLAIDPLGERTAQQAITLFKLSLLCMSYRKLPASLIAGVCLKTAWIYRDLKDNENEMKYLLRTIKYYTEGYSLESFPIGSLSEVRLAYLVGELYRRVGDFPTAIRWFGKAVNHPKAFLEPVIVKMARDQWSYSKEEYNAKNKQNQAGE